jgi:hypothetical protein
MMFTQLYGHSTNIGYRLLTLTNIPSYGDTKSRYWG